MTLQELAALLAERGYGYALKPITNEPELEAIRKSSPCAGAGRCTILAVQNWSSSSRQSSFARSGAERLSMSREAYLQRAAQEIADLILKSKHADLYPARQQRTLGGYHPGLPAYE